VFLPQIQVEMTVIAPLNGSIKHYEWGGYEFIPALLAMPNTACMPFAEYWLGVHPLADCSVSLPDGKKTPLANFIATNSGQANSGNNSFTVESIPFLLKILDVRDMLSIQVHPSKERAELEFRRENDQGISIDSPERNYKDANHKPELVVALGSFWLLHGFKKPNELMDTLQKVPEFTTFKEVFSTSGYEGLYRLVMEMTQQDVNTILQPLLDRIIPLYAANKLERSNPDFWAARAALTFSKEYIDRGIFSIYFFNLLHLEKGEAVYQAAGVPHAYLEGQNVEIMANSDNVLRGGLTHKHIDVPELLKNIRFEAAEYKILRGEPGSLGKVYKTQAPDFELHCLQLEKGGQQSFQTEGTEILLLTEGRVNLSAGENTVELKTGQPAACVLGGQLLHIKAGDGSTLFRAKVPLHNA
jgi:mannose-6-phosphate isomerase